MSNTDARGQQLDSNHSARLITEASANGHKCVNERMDDSNSLGEYINNTLAQKFSELTIGDAEKEHASCQAGGVTSRSPQLNLTRQDMAGHESLLCEAEEALRRQITHKINQLHTEKGPDSSKAFLSALCALSTASFDQLWDGVLQASNHNPSTPLAGDAGSRPPNTSESGKSRAERTQIWEGRLKRFAANAVGDLIQLVNSHWERLARGLEAQEFLGDQFGIDKRSRRLRHHLELQRLEQDAELHWLRRALALIRNLRDFEEYLEENGHPPSAGSNQRLRHAYLTEIYAASSSYSDADVKTAFKEDLRYAVRWMIFIRPFGLGAILVCGESISKLVYKTSGNNNGDLEQLATQIQRCHTINFQALCDILYLPVADMIRHYRVGDLHKSELVAKIQTVASRR